MSHVKLPIIYHKDMFNQHERVKASTQLSTQENRLTWNDKPITWLSLFWQDV